MDKTRSIEELKERLEQRRQWHLDLLSEIDDGLSQLDRLVSLAYGPQEEPKVAGREVPAELPKAEPRKTRDPEPTATDEDTLTERLEETIRDYQQFDMRVTDEVNARYGLSLNEKQVSNALRNLLKRGKIVLVRPGGPRRPAIYTHSSLYRGGSLFLGEGNPNNSEES